MACPAALNARIETRLRPAHEGLPPLLLAAGFTGPAERRWRFSGLEPRPIVIVGVGFSGWCHVQEERITLWRAGRDCGPSLRRYAEDVFRSDRLEDARADRVLPNIVAITAAHPKRTIFTRFIPARKPVRASVCGGTIMSGGPL